MQCFVGSFTKQAAAGDQNISLASHAGLPNLSAMAAGTWALFFSSVGNNAVSNTWSTQIHAFNGFVANGNGLAQYAISCHAADNQVAGESNRRAVAAAISFVHTGGTVHSEATFSSFTSATNMRINWSVNDGDLININYMLFTGLTDADVILWSIPASTGSKTVSGVGFNPDLVFHAHSLMTGVPQTLSSTYFSLGWMNKHGQQFANTEASQDNQNPNVSERAQRSDSCIVGTDHLGGYYIKAHFEEMNSDGFKVYFSTNGLDASYDIISLCLDGIGSKIGAFTKGTGAAPLAQEIASRHDGTVRGMILSGLSTNPNANPSAYATWTLGMWDGTNQRCVALGDSDAVSPTVARSIWSSDSVTIFQESAVGSTSSKGVLTSADEDSFIETWNPNSGNTPEVGYCILMDAGEDTYPAKVLV